MESDTVEVTGDFGQDLIFIPNAFTPNADGLNDIFLPVSTDLQAYDLQVFDRWGQLIFATTDPAKGWDGTLEGRLVHTGVYTYKVGYMTSCSENRVVKTGCVLVAE